MAGVKYFVSIYLILAVSIKSFTRAGEVITSPPITNWGKCKHHFNLNLFVKNNYNSKVCNLQKIIFLLILGGFMNYCPNGTVVQGFQLKTEPYRGPLIDDTALNGVRFYCGNPLNPVTTLTSSVGNWGNWGNLYSCGNGSIVGFQLRVEAFGVIDDETATNNARFFCSNMEEDRYIEGDGLNFGLWRGSVRCPSGQTICGIQTQIQPDRGLLRKSFN